MVWEIQAETLYVCPKHGFGHTHKVSAWNFHKKYDFCNTQISREYLGELMKHLPGTYIVYNMHQEFSRALTLHPSSKPVAGLCAIV